MFARAFGAPLEAHTLIIKMIRERAQFGRLVCDILDDGRAYGR